jgi:exopolysaccharide biosynthesis polyprenyl glycosylphosphotransferase
VTEPVVSPRVAHLVPPSPRTSVETVAAPVLVPDLVPDLTARPMVVPERPLAPLRRWWRLPLRAGIDAAVVVACASALHQLGAPAPLEVSAAAVIAWPLLLMVLGTRDPGPVPRSRISAASGVLRAMGAAAVLAWLAHPVAGSAAAPEGVVPLLLLLGTTTVLGAALFPLARPVRVVLAGASSDVSAALAELGSSPRFDVVGVCLPPRQDDDEPGQGHVFPDDGVPVSHGFADATRFAAERAAQALVLLPSGTLPFVTVRRLLWAAPGRDLDVYVGTGLLDVAPSRTSVVQGVGLDLLHVRPAPTRGARRLVKEVVERVVALGGLVVLSPLLLALAVAIRRETPGPALFRQQRVGRNGELFTMVKFRTMTQTAEADKVELSVLNDCDAVLFKMRSDPRVTGLGRWLRRYSVDELPQLWNVVTGDMSLVGPRPALPDEVEKYDIDPRRRLAVKPGLTGLWQVSGRSDLSWPETVRLDVQYVDNWSLGLDVSILCRTIGAVLDHRGAY